MSESPNKLIRFWQELKRRKVFKVIAIYAGTAFIILEVVNNLVSPLRLPEWAATFVVVLLAIGFPFAIIFSWIFDITPEGLKKTESVEAAKRRKYQAVQVKRRLRASDIIIAAMAIVIVILLYPKIFKKDTLEKLRTSGERIVVAVMPFQNMTNDTTWNVWQDGIQANLIASLTNSEELKVRQTETINNLLQSKSLTNYAAISPSIASNISQKLDANVFIYGSINQSGSTIRVNAQIADSKTKDALKSFQIDGTSENILQTADSLSKMVKNYLVISKMQKELPVGYSYVSTTNSPEAFRYFIYGQNAFHKKDFPTASKLFLQALTVDSNFASAALSLSTAYYNRSVDENSSLVNQGLFDKARKLCIRLYEKEDQMPGEMQLRINKLHALLFETPYEEIQYSRQLQEIDDQSPYSYYSIGFAYFRLYQYDKVIPELEKALEIYKKWDSKPSWVYDYLLLGMAYHKTGQYKKEKILYKKAEQDFPDDPELTGWEAISAYSEGDTALANRFVEKTMTYLKSTSLSEADLSTSMAFGYKEAGLINETEKYYRRALSLEPENPIRLNNLAYLLIDKDLNINEGLELADKVLILNPENYNCLHTKGWGLYKQGKFHEALDILQKSWDLRREKAVYNHEAYLHLEAAKKAVANQKRTDR